MKNDIDFETKEELAAAERDLGIPYLVSGRFPNRSFGDWPTYEDRVAEFAFYYLVRADSLRSVTRFRLGRLFLLALADSCSADSLDAGSRRIADLLLQSEAHKWTGALDYDEVQGRVDSFTDYLPIMRSSYSDARKLLSSELSLRFPAVDWARANANPDRLSEFVELYRRRCKEFDGETDQQLLELIVRSAEHVFREGGVNAALRRTICRLLDGVWASSLFEMVYPACNLKVCREFSSYAPGLSYRGHEVLSERFGLRCPAPDWGAFNADGSRVGEFLTVYLSEKARQPLVWQECLGDLILGSLHDACVRAELDADTATLAKRFVREQTGEQAANLARWMRPGNRRLAEFIINAAFQVDPSVAQHDQTTYLEGVLGCREVSGSCNEIAVYYLTRLFGLASSEYRRWETTNADSGRLHEFLAYYLSSCDQHQCLRLTLGGLILASLDRALHRNTLQTHTRHAAEQFVYWRAAEFGNLLSSELEAGPYGRKVREFVEELLTTRYCFAFEA